MTQIYMSILGSHVTTNLYVTTNMSLRKLHNCLGLHMHVSSPVPFANGTRLVQGWVFLYPFQVLIQETNQIPLSILQHETGDTH